MLIVPQQASLFAGKVCPRCREFKPFSCFGKDRSKRDGLNAYCKPCASAMTQRYYVHATKLTPEERKTRRKASVLRYLASHRGALAAKNQIYRLNNRKRMSEKTKRRMALVKKNGGNYTQEEWRALCEKYGNVCLCCGLQKPLTADHILPIVEGGTSDIGNIQPLCLGCNSRKHTRHIDYRPF